MVCHGHGGAQDTHLHLQSRPPHARLIAAEMAKTPYHSDHYSPCSPSAGLSSSLIFNVIADHIAHQ
jgi:hypothetical protein